MKEVEFRAWNKITKTMIDLKACTQFVTDLGGLYLPINDDKVILVEYTGFKDKNGKKIFESDKLTWNGWVRIVCWDNEKAGFYLTNNINNYKLALWEIMDDKPEIIGNIYEHGHFLDK